MNDVRCIEVDDKASPKISLEVARFNNNGPIRKVREQEKVCEDPSFYVICTTGSLR